MGIKVTGGDKLKQHIREARMPGIMGVEVGFWSTDVYPAGHRNAGQPVTEVARVNEKGSDDGKIPSRPFMTTTLRAGQEVVQRELGRRTPMQPRVDRSTATEIARILQGEMKEQIENGQWEPNAPYTQARKGFNNPLIETRFMKDHVLFRLMAHGEILEKDASFVTLPQSRGSTGSKGSRNLRSDLYAIGKLLGDVQAVVGGSGLTGIRSGIYTTAKGLGDVTAVEKGQVGERIVSRATGKVATQALQGVSPTHVPGSGRIGQRLVRRGAGRVTGRGISTVRGQVSGRAQSARRQRQSQSWRRRQRRRRR